MSAKKQAIFLAVAIFLAQSAMLTDAFAKETAGLTKTRPASGRFVKTDQGFMVPYTAKIPGTDITYEMMPIPGGKFKMGSPPSEAGRESVEGPQFEVVVKPFWIGKYEITWAEYKEYMRLYSIFKDFEARKLRIVTKDNLADAITAPTELYDPSFTFENGEDPRQPAVTVTQYATKQYTKWLSAITGRQYRLPSEAEWEYACRAGTTTAYSFGDDPAKLGDYAWYYENSDETSRKVGQKKPNPWGLFDMHGNVWEWVLDEYREDGYAKFAGKTVAAENTIAWPTKPYPLTVRGGSWDDDAPECRSAAKLGSHDIDWKSEDPNLPLSPWWFTSDPSRGVGFRIIRPLQTVSPKEMAKYWEAKVEMVVGDIQNRLEEGRGALGLVDDKLPADIKKLKEN